MDLDKKIYMQDGDAPAGDAPEEEGEGNAPAAPADEEGAEGGENQ